MMTITPSFPDPPKLSGRPEVQEEFDRWYYNLKMEIINQFEEVVDKLNELEARVDSINNKT